MLKNFLSNLENSLCRYLSRFYSNTNNSSKNLEAFLLVPSKREFRDCSSVSDTVKNEAVNTNLKEWNPLIHLLKNYGFDETNCLKMIKNYPTLLKLPEETLVDALKQWNHCDLQVNRVQSILINQPHFLSLELHEIRNRLAYLHSCCKNKKKIATSIIRNPNIMTDDWKCILTKIDYLQKTKRINLNEIICSKALSKPLDFIKLRFEILEKCGIFKVIKVMPHKIKDIKHENPPLEKITDLTDKTFALSVAHISEEEYLMCKDLYSNSEEFDEDDTDSECDEQNN